MQFTEEEVATFYMMNLKGDLTENEAIGRLCDWLEAKKKIDKWEIPHMVVTKQDLILLKEGTEEFNKWKEKVEKLTDEEMENIAYQMSKGMMEQFNVCLEIVAENFIKIEEEEN
jgi:hypothetical protein